MKVIYTDQPIPSDAFNGDSIFLLGPTPRKPEVDSWRPEALEALSRLKFRGTVFVPEWSKWGSSCDFQTQTAWERKGLMKSRRIVAWLPRRITQGMPAFTSNVEFGYYIAKRPDALYYGRPFWAEECNYLDWLYSHETGRKPSDNLMSLLDQAIRS